MFSLIVITENVVNVGKCVEALPRHHTAECAVMVAWEHCLQSLWLYLINVSPPGKNRCPKSDRSRATRVYNVKEQ